MKISSLTNRQRASLDRQVKRLAAHEKEKQKDPSYHIPDESRVRAIALRFGLTQKAVKEQLAACLQLI